MSALTAGADLAWKLAEAEATRGGHGLIENALLLVGILSLEKVGGATAVVALAPDVRQTVEEEAHRIAAVLERCGLEAAPLRRLLRQRAGKGGPEQRGQAVNRSPACKETFYRAAMLSGPAGVSALDLLAALGEAPDALLARAVRDAGGSVERLREEARRAARERPAAPGAVGPAAQPSESPTPLLDRHGRDLTALAARGELGPVMGQRAELLQVLQVLARGRGNPVLVGEPGVGKTALVEALALRAAQGKDPAVLGGRRIVALSLQALAAETKDAALLGRRIGDMVAEAGRRPEIILFLDELHAVAIDLLKPALTRGDLRTIAATTTAAYRSRVESDPTLEPRCERVLVSEPSYRETLEILQGLRPGWEERHSLKIDEDALEAAIALSVRFEPSRNLPAKAIALVAEAAARGPAPEGGRITKQAVARVLAERAALPADRVAEILDEKRPPTADLEALLRERILGQDESLARLARRLRLALAEANDAERPLLTLLFLGPTGVGKTETARRTAALLFGSEQALLRLDASPQGRPPAEAESEDEGRLVSRLRTSPNAVVLLHEADKAHPRLLERFRQVFETGLIRDDAGRTADARQAVFVLTAEVREGGEHPMEAARRLFRPELLGRIDETIVFRPLRPEDALPILRKQLRALGETMESQHGVRLQVDSEAEAFIARAGFEPTSGLRELPRVLERLVTARLSSLILDGKIRRHPAWRVAYDEGGIYVVPGG
jgi:ATP-dependent Clp protease ATP-binding subunit ClpC